MWPPATPLPMAATCPPHSIASLFSIVKCLSACRMSAVVAGGWAAYQRRRLKAESRPGGVHICTPRTLSTRVSRRRLRLHRHFIKNLRVCRLATLQVSVSLAVFVARTRNPSDDRQYGLHLVQTMGSCTNMGTAFLGTVAARVCARTATRDYGPGQGGGVWAGVQVVYVVRLVSRAHPHAFTLTLSRDPMRRFAHDRFALAYPTERTKTSASRNHRTRQRSLGGKGTPAWRFVNGPFAVLSSCGCLPRPFSAATQGVGRGWGARQSARALPLCDWTDERAWGCTGTRNKE